MGELHLGRIESDAAFREATPRQLEVLRLIRDHGVITRGEIATLLQTSASQVSRLTAPLIARELVAVEPRLPLAEGRPVELLTLSGDRHFVAGIDLGGLAQHAVVTNLRGDIVGTASASDISVTSRTSVVSTLVDLVDRAVADAGLRGEQILGVGVGVRAIIDPISGVISAGPETPSWSPDWMGFDLRDQLSRALPSDRLVINDTVRALAAVEQRFGCARSVKDFVYLLADSGIGAALMFDGQSYIGPGHLAGEVGHITLDPRGPICGCGRRGCVEVFASTSAMLTRARASDPTIESIDELNERAMNGDATSRDILMEGGAALGRAIAILLNLLSPALIVVGGRATSSPLYMEHAQASARAEALAQPFHFARIRSSELRSDAGALGAATLILDELFGAPFALSIDNHKDAAPAGVLSTQIGGKNQ